MYITRENISPQSTRIASRNKKSDKQVGQVGVYYNTVLENIASRVF